MNTIRIVVTYSLATDAKRLAHSLKERQYLEAWYDDHYISTITKVKNKANIVIIETEVDPPEDLWETGGMKPGDEIQIIKWLASALSVDQEMHGVITDKDDWYTKLENDAEVLDTYNFTYEGETENYSVTHTCIHVEKEDKDED